MTRPPNRDRNINWGRGWPDPAPGPAVGERLAGGDLRCRTRVRGGVAVGAGSVGSRTQIAWASDYGIGRRQGQKATWVTMATHQSFRE